MLIGEIGDKYNVIYLSGSDLIIWSNFFTIFTRKRCDYKATSWRYYFIHIIMSDMPCWQAWPGVPWQGSHDFIIFWINICCNGTFIYSCSLYMKYKLFMSLLCPYSKHSLEKVEILRYKILLHNQYERFWF